MQEGKGGWKSAVATGNMEDLVGEEALAFSMDVEWWTSSKGEDGGEGMADWDFEVTRPHLNRGAKFHYRGKAKVASQKRSIR
jgi:hypothetical protein